MDDEQLKAWQAETKAMLLRDLAQDQQQASRDAFLAERQLFINTLVNARLAARLTQRQLGQLTGLRQGAISRIENGHGNPGLNTLLTLARALQANLVVEYEQ